MIKVIIYNKHKLIQLLYNNDILLIKLLIVEGGEKRDDTTKSDSNDNIYPFVCFIF